MTQPKVLLMDGMGLLFRGFFATSVYGNYMYNQQGVPTNGVYGMIKHFLSAIDTFQPTHVMCCWDTSSHTFRTRLYPAYKAKRPEPPEELLPQFAMAKTVMDEAFAVPNIGIEDLEADDCIGTIAKALTPEHDVVILTADQDMLQLIESHIHVALMKKGIGNYEMHTEQTFIEKKGYRPDQVIDMKGLMGDSSDNYPGVKGIGEKTACALLRQYGTVETILQHLDELPKGVKKKIENNLEMLYISRELAKIRLDAPLTYSLSDAMWRWEKERAVNTLKHFGINITLSV
ncbi:5'-3' exonuclease [Alteribacillus persepolensis]|uniref:5'-3' exonuclease n=1 Tax=Alteribacillus persepolensis TaxID=568899 RepID=A0A1G7Z6A6_9BACI|nr:5'-3' exonuclease [Alteribacillus persepolensis]SDH04036.1 5'-3' exonuclease [Alteribacillus persepolensis]